MPAPSKKTEANLKRLRAMHAQGASDREIGEALGIGHPTVGRWRDDLGLAAVGSAGPRSSRPRTVTPVEERQAAHEAAGELARPPDELPPGDGAADVVKGRLATVRRLIDDLRDSVGRSEGGYPATSWARLVELEAKLAAALAELTPPEPPDPERDVANVEAAESVRRKLERLVGVAEASSRCCHCGRPPFGPGRMEPEGVGR